MNFVECLLVGDESIGKKCLIITYTTNKFPLEYIPSVLDFYTHTVLINEQAFTLRLSIAPVFYNLLRPLHYQQSDVFLVCFSVVQPSTFQNVKKTWVPEILNHNPKTPFILVGTQIDLRTDIKTLEKLTKNKEKVISMEMGEKLAKELNALKYIECSALTQEGLKKVFDEACLAKLYSPRNQLKKKAKCEIC